MNNFELPQRRVLIVDDNHDAADSLAMLLETLGQDVRTVYSGAAALDAVGDWRPEIAFLDIGLPDMDGYTLAKRLREQLAAAAPVLVALSGYPEDTARAQQAGFDRHLLKPAQLEGIEAVLRNPCA